VNASSPNPRKAFWLSLLVPGLGLFYAGAPLRAVLVVVLALLGLGGIADSASFMGRRPEYAYYGALATVVLVAAWWGGAWHAHSVAARFQAWPAFYRFLGRRALWQALRPAGAEIGMVVVFAALLALYAQYPKPPRWVPDMPRYWFLYEAFGALYVAVATQARVAGFFAITIAATLALALVTRIPYDTLAFAYLLALPSCRESLRSEDARRVHGYRFAACLVSAFLALFAYAIVLSIAEAVTGLPQYKLRLASDYNVSVAAFGILYYALRGGFAVVIGRFAGPPSAAGPASGNAPHP
jgi:TM2 domain-containing membrane protein YozV